MSTLDLALVGNGSYSALIDPRGRVVWACLPRFDGDPVFSSLMAGAKEPESGFWDVQLDGCVHTEQHYLQNSAVVVTILDDGNGNIVEITDFAPRFQKSGRMYRPLMLVRQLRPLQGEPRIRIRLRPVHGYGAARAETTHGSNHIRYVMPDLTVRLTSESGSSSTKDFSSST